MICSVDGYLSPGAAHPSIGLIPRCSLNSLARLRIHGVKYSVEGHTFVSGRLLYSVLTT